MAVSAPGHPANERQVLYGTWDKPPIINQLLAQALYSDRPNEDY